MCRWATDGYKEHDDTRRAQEGVVGRGLKGGSRCDRGKRMKVKEIKKRKGKKIIFTASVVQQKKKDRYSYEKIQIDGRVDRV